MAVKTQSPNHWTTKEFPQGASCSWNTSLGAKRKTSNRGIQTYWPLCADRALSPPAGQCSRPEMGGAVVSGSPCEGLEGASSGAHLACWGAGSLTCQVKFLALLTSQIAQPYHR